MTSKTCRRPRALGRGAAVACAAAVVAGVLSACGTPGASTSPAPSTGAVSTAVPTGKVTLTVISSENSGTTKALAQAFEKKYPNVTVDFQYTQVDDYNKSLNLTLSSDSAPDLALLNMLGTTVKANLVRPLDPYAAAYGWTGTYPSSQLDQWRSDPTGTQLGNGTLWAAPAGFSVVGVYYNKAEAAKLGITAPRTLADFTADLAKAKAAGVLPLQLGNLAGHSSFVFQSVADSVDGAAKSTKWAYGDPGSTINTPGGNEGAKDLADWAHAGYIPSSANGTDLPGSVAAFGKGQGLFLVDGNWDATLIDKALPGQAGFFPFPSATAASSATGIGTSVAYAIPTRAKHPDLAAAFLNFMNSPEAAQVEFDTGFMPVDHADTVKAPAGSVLGDIVTAWGQINQDNGLVPFFNNSTQTMNDTLTSSSQQLIGGQSSPAAFLQAVQADWAKGHQ